MILHNKKNIKQFIQNKKNSFASILAISAISSVMTLTVPVSISATAIHNIADKTPKTNIVLSNTVRIVEVKNQSNLIIAGESKIGREEREVREAKEAADKAEAENQARIALALAESAPKKVANRARKVYADPSDFDQIYQRAQAAYGVDWRILKAIHYVETGCSGSTGKSSFAGATGPMQFLPSIFRAHGVDGNGDGLADISNVEDSIFTAAKYLSACGYPNVQKALWGYNPSSRYYAKVMDVAHSLGY